jgi:hypothetical protein
MELAIKKLHLYMSIVNPERLNLKRTELSVIRAH